ncbi:MAG TPA: hypothetical protein VHZ29_08495 [Rhizomicrobium sp.]|jgi:multisubunit Na+/H+ antiporter MnhB subunit|nr:hypothetical protein [Rhizomicrobium sp.]
MAFREKSAWIALVASLAIYGSYLAGGGVSSFGALIGATVLFVLAMIVLTVAAAVMSPRDASQPADEREKLIALKSSQVCLVVITLGALGAIAALFGGIERAPVANFLFFSLVAGEIAKDAAQIVYFRRGV